MTKLIAVIFLFMLVSPISGLSSYSNSQTFVLDTANPFVSLNMPSGGEIWFANNYNLISWNASDSNLTPLPIALYYSRDGGNNWQTIESNFVNSGLYDWMIPYISSNEAKVKIEVADSFGNSSEDLSDVFSVVLVTPASPGNVRLELINDSDILITWDEVTTDSMGNPLNPDGYIILISQEPVDLEQFYFLAATNSDFYLHENILPAYPRIFYCIIAYKDEEPETIIPVNDNDPSSGQIPGKDIPAQHNIILSQPTN